MIKARKAMSSAEKWLRERERTRAKERDMKGRMKNGRIEIGNMILKRGVKAEIVTNVLQVRNQK